MGFASGVASDLNCSLCWAGTYGTGSGQDALTDIEGANPVLILHLSHGYLMHHTARSGLTRAALV